MATRFELEIPVLAPHYRLDESAATYVITLTLDPENPVVPDISVTKEDLEKELEDAGSTVVIGDVTQPVVSSVTIEISADSALSEQEQAPCTPADGTDPTISPNQSPAPHTHTRGTLRHWEV